MSITNKSLIKQYASLHAGSEYGTTSYKLLPRIMPEIYELRPKSILDYGCGQSRLIDLIDNSGQTQTYRYDPSIEEIARKPVSSVDLVLNTDVLEHIPEEDLDDVLADIRGLSSNVFFSISTVPAQQILPSGENAHCTVKPHSWWKQKLEKHFDNVELITHNRKRCLFRTWKSKKSTVPGKIFIFLVWKTKHIINKHIKKRK
jgi:2-polyprenyl-3-methyl-5-hydroxy-6-metoxy-1,4-benzoquinol methylase